MTPESGLLIKLKSRVVNGGSPVSVTPNRIAQHLEKTRIINEFCSSKGIPPSGLTERGLLEIIEKYGEGALNYLNDKCINRAGGINFSKFKKRLRRNGIG